MRAPVVAGLLALIEEAERDPSLAARLARVVAPHVFQLGITASKQPTGTFSSRRGCGAPGLSDEQSKRIARVIGVQRGRWWIYTAEQLAVYERGDRDVKPANDTPAPAVPWHPRDAAAALGLRPTRTGGAR